MEVPRIEFYSNTHTPGKNGLYSQRQNNNLLKRSPPSWRNWRQRIKKSKYFSMTTQAKKRLSKKIAQKKRINLFWTYFTRYYIKNGVVERWFVTLYSWIYIIMVHTGLNDTLKTGLWPECAATVTELENILVNLHKEKCAYDKFYVNITDYA